MARGATDATVPEIWNANRKPGAMEQEKVHVRLLIIAGTALFWMAAILGRVAYLQLFRHSEYLSRAARQQRRRIDVAPKRGVIYDRNMRPLAMSIPVQSAFAVPSEIKDVGMATRLLSGELGIPAEEIRQELESENTFVWIKRKLSPDKVEAIQSLNLKGIYLQEENQRYYPKRDMAAHVLGFVNVDEKGMGGVEEKYDDLIRSKAEKVVVMTDGRQRWYDGGETLRDRGANAVLTLDERIQYIVERELAAAIEKRHAPAGSVIVQDPNSGAILAMANWPRFNPNAATDSPDEARMIRAIYKPGSTFKLITLAAAFDQGLIRADEVFDCENGAVTVAGHLIHDHKRYGMLTVADILANSSDVGAIKIALRLGSPKFFDYIKGFGFGTPTGVDLPGESRGPLRRLMEGVILHGTGKAARLDGWTAAGKTGTAQKIDPATGRYSPKNVIASFAGFAPINNPAVTILVTIDSPAGFPHDGATVAAPVFKRIAEQVLPYLDVARDVPLSSQLMQTAYRTKMENDEAPLDDLAPIDFSAQLEDAKESVKANSTPTTLQKLPEVMMAVDEGGDIAVPDFTGKTMREVTDGCLKLGLNPVLVGSNLAIQQVPAAGAKVRRGSKLTVQFGMQSARSGKAH